VASFFGIKGAFFSKTTGRICANFFPRFRKKHLLIATCIEKHCTRPWRCLVQGHNKQTFSPYYPFLMLNVEQGSCAPTMWYRLDHIFVNENQENLHLMFLALAIQTTSYRFFKVKSFLLRDVCCLKVIFWKVITAPSLSKDQSSMPLSSHTKIL